MTKPTRAIDVAWPQETWRLWVRELKAEVERLQAENAAMREIVQAVANMPYDDECPWENMHAVMEPVKHAPDCPVTKARALLAAQEQPGEGGVRR